MTLVERRVDKDLAVVGLSRPEALNAISGALAQELAEAFGDTAGDANARVVVLEAAGDRAFCVGADLKERNALDDDGWLRNRTVMRAMFESIRSVPVPTIASVFGFVLGGGFELALSCDLIVAADDAVFGLPEATVGIVPGGGGTQLLARRIGAARAKELVFTGRRVAVEEAHAWGLVSRVVARQDLSEATMELARKILASSPVAVREAKRAMDEGVGVPLAHQLELEDLAWRRAIASEDRREGIAAWAEKRAPRWRGR